MDCPIARLPDCPIAKRVAAGLVFLLVGLSAALPTRAQLLITDTHTFTVSGGQQLTVNYAISGAANTILNIEGDGRVTLTKNSNGFQGRVFIRGAEFWNPQNGLMAKPISVTISNGGTLIWDNTGSATERDHFSSSSSAILAGGTLRIFGRTGTSSSGGSGETFKDLSLAYGANTIDINSQNPDTHTEVNPEGVFTRGSNTATLNLTGNRAYSDKRQKGGINLRYSTSSGSFAIGGIIPWGTVKGNDFVTPILNGGRYYLVAYTGYHSGAPTTWTSSHNISLSDTEDTVLGSVRTINSLRMPQASALNLNGYSLVINSGGLLVTGDTYIRNLGSLTTGSGRSLYAHIYGALLFQGYSGFSGGMDLVKTGSGELILQSDAIHELGTVTINEGSIKLQNGRFSVSDTITVGDGAGTDLFEIAHNLTNRIVKTGGGLPSLSLHGNPFKPTTDAAILRLRGNTRQQLDTLHIQARGTLDFTMGSSRAAPNILYLDQLTFNDTAARLIIRNWIDQADYLLVKRSWGDAGVPPILNQIIFEGYGPARWHWHDLQGFDGYWQITPLPEPSTYGAIVTVIGLGLALFRRRRRA